MADNADIRERCAELRPRLHRYCARMVGSSIEGEDMVQDVLLRALEAATRGETIDNLEGWLFRAAHNRCLDLLRARARHPLSPLEGDLPGPAGEARPGEASLGFRLFLELPVLQRCAVVLKDVLGHSVEEIAEVAGCTVPAAKSALQRGRLRLRELARRHEGDLRLPLLSDEDRARMLAYVGSFRSGDFDRIRAMLAEDVRLDLVNRLDLHGRDRVAPYFTRYAEATQWRFAFGAVEGRPAMLVFDEARPADPPAHFVLLEWRGDAVARIRDYLFAPYVMDGVDWTRLG
ncbi:sigma-70 family RNA polymerase sigma factor [Alsobacter sp. SYSU M60028]|uniref:Sigma-70 family RNA polymerase sigma factor n=1 Tax=Alsobacter ponti TaxID=2962936 RepID=A0ABT1L8C7_9HYPH|nr:sigma-70 family RNA polymerase sigma factor [Alsobacter ponti]MCP8937750.1 sigma-70 family RNA polymerase sigma factor [Alsobacter ponti]